MGIRKQRKRHGGISDAEEQSHRLFHLYRSDFPGLSFEFKILQPGECEGDLCISAKTIIDHRGKVRLDQNDGQPVPLAQIPNTLTGKDADTVDGYHAADLIRPISMTFLADGSVVEWYGQPAVLTEFLGVVRHRMKFDLTKFIQARLVVNVATAGATSAKLKVQCFIAELGWDYLDGLAGPSVDINATGLSVSSWVNLTSEAKADADLRIVGLGGNGLTGPGFGSIAVQFK